MAFRINKDGAMTGAIKVVRFVIIKWRETAVFDLRPKVSGSWGYSHMRIEKRRELADIDMIF